jgi:hypothetical protein
MRYIPLQDPDQAVGLTEWQRRQDDAIEHTEYGSVGADAESERQHRDHRKASILVQHARAKAHILQELLKPSETPHLPLPFLDLGQLAELASTSRFRRLKAPAQS